MDIKGTLTKKYGPLPAWAWAIITAAILLLLYMHFSRSEAKAQQNAAGDPLDDPNAGGSYGSDLGGGGTFGGGGSDGGSTPLGNDPGIGGDYTPLENTNVGDGMTTSIANVDPVVQPPIQPATNVQPPVNKQAGNAALLGALASVKLPQLGAPQATAVKQAIQSVKVPTGPVSVKAPISVKTLPSLAPKATAPIKYYTYKKDVPLKSGQTLKFTTGRGYYAG